MSSKYRSIQCFLHPVLLRAAKFKENCEIKFLDINDKETTASGIIIDIIHFHQDEFLILNNGIKIRLDSILELNGKKCTEEYCRIHYREMNCDSFPPNNLK